MRIISGDYMKNFLFIFFSFVILTSIANAGVIVGGTRVIYPEGSKDVSISVENKDETPYLIQSWIENAKGDEQSDFIITPPLFRLNQDKANVLRIFLTDNKLPDDRESLFWLNIKNIPATKRTENSLHIAFKTQIKLIYRPSSIKGVNFIEEQKKLTWSKRSDKIIVNNPTPYYMNFQSISFNDKKIDDASYVPPFSTSSFNVSDPISKGIIKWEIINDYGYASAASELKI